jgi:hypothetical protein
MIWTKDVSIESLANMHTFGHPVTIDYTHPENVFFLDKTGDNMYGKDDGNQGGQKKVVPKGEIPKELVGVKDLHFTIAPITDATGTLRIVMEIFSGKELSPEWSLGIDIFAEWDSSDEFNFRLGKQHPGLSLLSPVNREEIPVLFAATPKASKTSTILMETFQEMDEAGITQHGVDENGNMYHPAAVIYGRISRMSKDFLRYINDKETNWEVNLGTPYGTEYWQLHDDKRQNGEFKSELALSKSRFYKKKWLAGLDPEILPCEIVIVIRDAIMKSFMNSQYSTAALLHRGWNPNNGNSLDNVQILVTATEAVQNERNIVLQNCGKTHNASAHITTLYSKQNLLEFGSGRLAGGADAAQQITEPANSLNVLGLAASGIMPLMQENNQKNNARQLHHERHATEPPSADELRKRYKDSHFLTAGQVFGLGNGCLGKEVHDEVIRRNEARKEKEAGIVSRKKSKLRDLISRAKLIKDKLKDKNYKLTIDNLRLLVAYKKRKGDAAIPSGKAALLAQ